MIQISPRQDTKVNWDKLNPILGHNEIGIDTTNMRYKIGNGIKSWNELSYQPETLSKIWLEFNLSTNKTRA